MEQRASGASPQPGEVYRHPDHGEWRVVSFIMPGGFIGLTGPGPCRSYFKIKAAQLDAAHGWVRQPELEAPRTKVPKRSKEKARTARGH